MTKPDVTQVQHIILGHKLGQMALLSPVCAFHVELLILVSLPYDDILLIYDGALEALSSIPVAST